MQNIIVHTNILQDDNTGFSVPVNHIIRNRVPNKFPAIKFKRRATFVIVDTKSLTPAKPIRMYEADDNEISEDHFELLLCALVDHGCCIEQKEYTYVPNFTPL